MRLRDFGFLLSAFVCFVVFLLPLKVVTGFLPAEKIRLIGLEGELHQGQVASVYLKYGSQWLDLGSLNWQLDIPSLFSLAPTVQLNGGNAGFNYQGQMTVSSKSFALKEFTAKAPVEMLKPFIHLPITARGQLSVDVAQMEVDRETQWFNSLQGQFSFMNGAIGIGGPAFTLGDYGVRYALNQQNQVAGDVQHLGGPLIANGHFTLEQQGQFRFAGELERGAGLDKQVWNTLQMVSKPNGEKLKLDYQMQF